MVESSLNSPTLQMLLGLQISRISTNYNHGFRSINTPTRLFMIRPAASLRKHENKEAENDFASKLKEEMEVLGICYNNISISSTLGEYTRLMCPKCKGGLSMEKSLSFHISWKKDYALWRCFNLECGWAGHKIFGHNMTSTSHQISLKLEPLGDTLVAYFAKRMISMDTLMRNHVMQVSSVDQIIIAFAYRQNGMIIGCKYRTLEKKFWQEKGTDKVLYGLDDVKGADDIIIVEGEIDKLSFEEAGFLNCVSVPNGAPQTSSIGVSKELEQETTRFSYLWSCKELLEKKVSRIVLATDSDLPGQALAEQLAHLLGRERCWKVCWPKKDESSSYKDANEVLVNLGIQALKEVIQCAVPYDQMQNLT